MSQHISFRTATGNVTILKSDIRQVTEEFMYNALVCMLRTSHGNYEVKNETYQQFVDRLHDNED